MINVFNTESLTKEKFVPQKENTISMYVCGPTVYDYIHIGNARSIVAFDTIRRYLEYKGYNVDFVSNFTDVDDKMINEARKKNITVEELADKNIEAYYEDVKAINVKKATHQVRATHVIPEILEFIQVLMEKGFAYEKNGVVFFRTKKSKDYNKLVHQPLEELESNASGRLTEEEIAQKEDPLDFVLWKGKKEPDETSWSSPWGEGRPGWHIECSVMSTKYLGNTIDIHAGGIDLVFPHHTNEIAQSEAKNDQKFVNYWMHNGFVTNKNEKMSKSKHNFTTLHDLLGRVDDSEMIRFYMASVHYRKKMNYSLEDLEHSRNDLNKIRNTYSNLMNSISSSSLEGEIDDKIKESADNVITRFEESMDDDFNVQNALTAVFELISLSNKYLLESNKNQKTIIYLSDAISKLMEVFGIMNLNTEPGVEELPNQIKNLLDDRLYAKEQKNFEKADAIRNELAELGIIIEDTSEGQRWRKA